MTGSDFSVVVQGPILSGDGKEGDRAMTMRCLASLRTFLPGAEIILSTWKGAHTEGLDYDRLVESDDPGAVPFRDNQVPPHYNNINRQIVSTRAGMMIAGREYTLKFRGDLFLESGGCLNHEAVLKQRFPGGCFQSRVLITPYHTRNPRVYPLLFSFSDIVQAGRTEDIRKLWSLPLAPEPETTRWLDYSKRRRFLPITSDLKIRVNPEQYLMLELLRTCGRPIHFDHPYDLSPARALISERTLIENFRVVEPEDLGVRLPERLLTAFPRHYFYCRCDWEKLCISYAQPGTRVLAQADLLFQIYFKVLRTVLRWIFIRLPQRMMNSR